MTQHSEFDLAWRLASVHDVCQQIGNAALESSAGAAGNGGASPPGQQWESANAQLGTVILRPHQVDAVKRVRNAIALHGGALLADNVGLGKTFVALAVARTYKKACVLAPAGILPMWREAIQKTNCTHVSLHSVHTFSRGVSRVAFARSGEQSRSLIVIDEAHYLRTRTTRRFSNVSQFSADCDVLLASATPLHNRPRELRSILSLFLGERADSLDAETLSSCVIKRSSAQVSHSLPDVCEHPPLAIPENRAVLNGILALAPPLPVQDGGSAAALIRLGLLRAWCSSDEALTDAIRRRQVRGEAMLQSLAEGRYPTERELQTWIAGNDVVQLGFPELLVAGVSSDAAGLMETLSAHLSSLESLLRLHQRTSRADAVRSSYLRQLLVSNGNHQRESACAHFARDVPIVAFSQFASTVRALHRLLGDLAGVASLTSGGGTIASGRISREQLITRFAPRSNSRPPPPERERVRLLLTTDLLAEGVNLQDAGIVVHLDLPWTDALRKQRVGRLVRMGSEHSTVHVHTIAPPNGTEDTLQLVATLSRKAGLHHEWVGSDAQSQSSSAADRATELRELMQRWSALVPMATRNELAELATPMAVLRGPYHSFLAAVSLDGKIQLVGASTVENSWAEPGVPSIDASVLKCENGPSANVARVLPIAREIDRLVVPACDDSVPHGEPHTITRHDVLNSGAFANAVMPHCESMIRNRCRTPVESAFTLIRTWVHEQTLRIVTGATSRQLAPLQQRALALLAKKIAETPATARPRFRKALANAEEQVVSARGAGAELLIAEWLLTHEQVPFADWLQKVPVFARVAGAHVGAAEEEPSWRVSAMVVLIPHDRNTSSAAPLECVHDPTRTAV